MTDRQIAEMFQKDWEIEKRKSTRKSKKESKNSEHYSCNKEWTDEEMDLYL